MCKCFPVEFVVALTFDLLSVGFDAICNLFFDFEGARSVFESIFETTVLRQIQCFVIRTDLS